MLYQTAKGFLSGLIHGHKERKGVRVFNYHGLVERKQDAFLERNFNTLDNFRKHVRFLRRYRILSLAELYEELHGEVKPSGKNASPAAVITFDDGYENNLLAAEILQSVGLPWCVFITTGAIGGERIIWTIELALLILHGHASQVEAIDKKWPLDGADKRITAFRAIAAFLKRTRQAKKQEIMSHIRNQFPQGKTQQLLEVFSSFRMLRWEQVADLTRSGVEIGSHGVNHEIHHSEQKETIRLNELRSSKFTLEKELDHRCRFFSFPNGNYIASSHVEVQQAGYDMAFTTRQDSVRPGANPYLLPRLEAPGCLSEFACKFFWKTGPEIEP